MTFLFTARTGTQIIIPFRGAEDDFRHLRVMGDLGQIVFVVRKSLAEMSNFITFLYIFKKYYFTKIVLKELLKSLQTFY